MFRNTVGEKSSVFWSWPYCIHPFISSFIFFLLCSLHYLFLTLALQCRGCKKNHPHISLFPASSPSYLPLLCCCQVQLLTHMDLHFPLSIPLTLYFHTFPSLNIVLYFYAPHSLQNTPLSSLFKCPQNLPPKLNSGDTCGAGLCVWCIWVCV